MLFRVIAALSLVLTFVSARGIEISTLVPQGNRDLGNINDFTDRKIINAFIKKNPNLPQELKTSTAYYVISQGPNKALVYVSGVKDIPYTGCVTVIYNGGPPETDSSFPEFYGPGKLNIASIRNLKFIFHNPPLPNNEDKTIIEAFVDNNRLPLGLKDMLKVTQKTNYSARLVMKRFNTDYEGDAVVHYTVRQR